MSGPEVLTDGSDDFEYPDVTEQDLEQDHEEIEITPEQEAALDAAWESLGSGSATNTTADGEDTDTDSP